MIKRFLWGVRCTLSKEAMQETLEIEYLQIYLMMVTGCNGDKALEVARIVPPSLRTVAKQMVTEGWTPDEIKEVIGDTLLCALWQLGSAQRELVRAIFKARTVKSMLKGDDNGQA